MRPFIHVNCAMSADGKIAGSNRKQVRISSDEDKQRVKDLRRKYDAILVGVGTVIADDPHLTVKGASYEENPIRIVLDPHGRTPPEALVVNGSAPTIMVTDDFCERTWENADAIRCGNPLDLELAMEALSKAGIESILVEGGGETIASFFREKMVDLLTQTGSVSSETPQGLYAYFNARKDNVQPATIRSVRIKGYITPATGKTIFSNF